MTYATTEDIQERSTRAYTAAENTVIEALLEDAAILIDAFNADAGAEAKKVVSCRMVIRAIGDGTTYNVPMGATQGSMAAGGYTQSWTISGGASGELYLGKTEKLLLGAGQRIGAGNPLMSLAAEVTE